MSTSFGILFSIKIAHSYYINECSDFEFLIPPDTAAILRNGKIITRTYKGIFYALCEKNEAGLPLASITGLTLRIGLKLNNQFFSNFTQMSFKSGTTPLYQNLSAPASLDPGVETLLTSSLFAHPLSKTTRPVTITVKDVNNAILQTTTISDISNTSPIPIDLRGFSAGVYTVNEKYTSSTKKTLYYLDPDLCRLPTFGIAEIKIAGSFYNATPPEFVINFTAKQETLKYYVVGKNYSTADLNNLLVTDAGFNEDARPQVLFTKVSQGAFTSTDISPSLLTDNSSKVVLFKSQSPVSRLEKPRKKIQLSKNNDIIMKHLPLPGIDKSSSDIIIPISKP